MSRVGAILSVILYGLAPASLLARDLTVLPHGAILENPVAERPLEGYSETVERPLFAETRRKLALVQQAIIPPPQPVQPEPPPNLVLSGVVATAKGMIAIVSMPNNANFIQAKVGDELSSWKITEINLRNMVVVKDSRRLELSMFHAEGTSTTPRTGISLSSDLNTHGSRSDDRLAMQEKLIKNGF